MTMSQQRTCTCGNAELVNMTLFTRYTGTRIFSTGIYLVVVPRYNTSTFGRRAFSVAGPTVWNSLPDKLRDPSLSIDSFRRQLKTFLFVD